MNAIRTTLSVAVLLWIAPPARAQELTDRQIADMDKRISLAQEEFERARTETAPSPSEGAWVLRSKHFVFGMPILNDDRHHFEPPGQTGKRAGISVLVREGFVIGHFDRMRSPLWVCQRWTKADLKRMEKVPSQERRWKVDLELPKYARVGTSYNGNQTKMDRGHMARHALNRAWGVDSSDAGCFMSNSTPQHRRVNRGDGWRELEDEVRDIVDSAEYPIEAVWTISGAIFRDTDNPSGEAPEHDFQQVEFIGDGFGQPFATYKIVGWFDDRGWFQARGFVFEQSDREPQAVSYLTKISDIEQRTGLNFFPLLKDNIERLIEDTQYDDLWGAQ